MYSYDKQFLDKTSKETGFLRDNLEKVFRLCDILEYLNTNPITKETLVLKGGTALNMVVFDIPRLSVDIDLDFCKSCSKDEMLKMRTMINSDILDFMFANGYALNPNTKNPYSLDSWVFYFSNAVGNKDVLKIEINYSMREHILALEEGIIINKLFNNNVTWKTLSPFELFGTKIAALINRSATRDLFDVYTMLKSGILGDDYDLLRSIVVFYLEISGDEVVFNSNMKYEKIKDITYFNLKRTLLPVLRKENSFDFEKAKIEVINFLLFLMSLSKQQKLFVSEFEKGNYSPHLLFNDNDIVSRIIKHPMALWKVGNKDYKN